MVIGKFIGWLRGAKDASPLPEELWQSTLAALPFLARLNDDERLRLRLLAEQFLAQKEFTSAGGLVLTDAMCASIAVQGCLPVLNLGKEGADRNNVSLLGDRIYWNNSMTSPTSGATSAL